MDYNMLASFMHGVNNDEPLLNEGKMKQRTKNCADLCVFFLLLSFQVTVDLRFDELKMLICRYHKRFTIRTILDKYLLFLPLYK